ncbi:enhanced intracellular survival protein Eis [Ornithinibacillus salinisoli]|uniref:Enhanced intracellular survival protein Eis n=1 Tax=Ornithinibacillus salinisoli TaxID=1848459 RepID=A0ABW4VXW8_9BACI
MIKELNIEHDYREIFDLSQFAFQYQLSETDLDKKRKEARRHIIWGYMDGDTTAAKLHLIPLSCYIGGKAFKMGGISSVATWPEYRRKGIVKELLAHALKYMKENGQTISYLHPFSVPFYRKFGWEIAFNEKSYTIPMEKLKKNWDGHGYVRRMSPDYNILNQIYSEYAKAYTGMLVRDEKWWEQRVLKDSMHIAVAYNEEETPEGYIIFEVKDKVFSVVEMVNRSLNGLRLLTQFIANHDSMVQKVEMIAPENDTLPLLIEDPRFEQKIEPYFMVRIVNVFEFLKHYPFAAANHSVSLHIQDDFLSENNGTYEIKRTEVDSNVTCTRADNRSVKRVSCSIQHLTTLFFGYKRPMELFNLGLIHGPKEEIEKLEEIIPKQQPFFADFF